MNQSLKGSVTTKAPEGTIISYAGQMQLHMATGQHHLTGEEVHFNSMPTMPDLLATYQRTRFYDQSGTGTLNTPIPDVDLTKKFKSEPLKVDQNLNITMDGMRVPTHEPFYGHRDQIISFAGGKPSALSLVPGTPEFVSQLNRTSDNPMIRAAQLQADMKVHLEGLGLGQGTANIKKLQTAANDFVNNYAKDFKLPSGLNLSQATDAVSSVVNQTIGSITGEAKNLLQNQIFVNQGGTLFTAGNLGQAVTGTVSNAIQDLTSLDTFTSTAGNILNASLPSSITGITSNVNLGNLTGNLTGGVANINLGQFVNVDVNLGNIAGNAVNNAIGNVANNIPGIGQLNTVTNTYKNVVGSQITSVTQVTSLVNNIGSKITSSIASVGRSIGKMFGF